MIRAKPRRNEYALTLALPVRAAAAIDDQQFKKLKDLVSKLGHKIEKQDQRIGNQVQFRSSCLTATLSFPLGKTVKPCEKINAVQTKPKL